MVDLSPWPIAVAAFIGSLAGATFGAMTVAVVVAIYHRPPRRKDRP